MTRNIILTFMVLLLVTLTACNSSDNEPENNDNRKPLRVLVIGNSYSYDAFVYVPRIVKDAAPNTLVTVGILYAGSCNLERHYNDHMLNGERYNHYVKSVDGKPWKFQKTTTIDYALADCNWDVIVMHQQSGQSFRYDTYYPLQFMVDWLSKNMDHTPEFAWILTPAYPDGSEKYTNTSLYLKGYGITNSQELNAANAECAKKVMDELHFNLLLPEGTAIENARLTELNIYGYFKHESSRNDGLGRLSVDGVHLQDGISRLVANYAVAEALLRRYCGSSIANDKLELDQDFVNEFAPTQMRQGIVEGISASNREVAKRCAIAACDNPYSITEP